MNEVKSNSRLPTGTQRQEILHEENAKGKATTTDMKQSPQAVTPPTN